MRLPKLSSIINQSSCLHLKEQNTQLHTHLAFPDTLQNSDTYRQRFSRGSNSHNLPIDMRPRQIIVSLLRISLVDKGLIRNISPTIVRKPSGPSSTTQQQLTLGPQSKAKVLYLHIRHFL